MLFLVLDVINRLFYQGWASENAPHPSCQANEEYKGDIVLIHLLLFDFVFRTSATIV